MRLLTVFVLSLFCLSVQVHADDDDTPTPGEIKTLFFGKDHRKAITDIDSAPWDAIGQLETDSGNLCTATLISPHIALTAGHCLLAPPGKFDPPVAIRFMATAKGWRYEIHDIDARVEPLLMGKLKADGDGWIVPPSAAPYDYAVVIIHNPPSAIQPVPVFSGSRAELIAALKAKDNLVTQAGYPADHLDNLYAHQDCQITGWAQKSVLSHRCDTLPGDSGSPLMLNTENGWQIIAVQSSAPGAQDRYRADNRAIAVTSFYSKLQQLAHE
ncbi:trypsin-like serine peptidase [Tatumella citrea]|uniref:Serine protease n=1 Tax=Tatumella citrea TaxID=53336 RepID=A0A1Y0LKV2_TATCI|nr:serine protease [Tatumella citrea]ARU94080.1 serine protease [Tatumella citrea]ARU98118.1 serine protease [Tatumella citrea]